MGAYLLALAKSGSPHIALKASATRKQRVHEQKKANPRFARAIRQAMAFRARWLLWQAGKVEKLAFKLAKEDGATARFLLSRLNPQQYAPPSQAKRVRHTHEHKHQHAVVERRRGAIAAIESRFLDGTEAGGGVPGETTARLCPPDT